MTKSICWCRFYDTVESPKTAAIRLFCQHTDDLDILRAVSTQSAVFVPFSRLFPLQHSSSSSGISLPPQSLSNNSLSDLHSQFHHKHPLTCSCLTVHISMLAEWQWLTLVSWMVINVWESLVKVLWILCFVVFRHCKMILTSAVWSRWRLNWSVSPEQRSRLH